MVGGGCIVKTQEIFEGSVIIRKKREHNGVNNKTDYSKTTWTKPLRNIFKCGDRIDGKQTGKHTCQHSIGQVILSSLRNRGN